ncbi:hypothetical protein ACEPAF_912 [Sanghuangporus sanghuang]
MDRKDRRNLDNRTSPPKKEQSSGRHISQAQGIRLGLPAPSGAFNGKTWLHDWLAACAGGCNADLEALHWYGVNATQFQLYLEEDHDTSQLPLWVTEWADINNAMMDPQGQITNLGRQYIDESPGENGTDGGSKDESGGESENGFDAGSASSVADSSISSKPAFDVSVALLVIVRAAFMKLTDELTYYDKLDRIHSYTAYINLSIFHRVILLDGSKRALAKFHALVLPS